MPWRRRQGMRWHHLLPARRCLKPQDQQRHHRGAAGCGPAASAACCRHVADEALHVWCCALALRCRLNMATLVRHPSLMAAARAIAGSIVSRTSCANLNSIQCPTCCRSILPGAVARRPAVTGVRPTAPLPPSLHPLACGGHTRCSAVEADPWLHLGACKRRA